MHLISNIRVENYRSIIEDNFPFSEYTPLVGYNNAGKTNVLNALTWLIKKPTLTHSDFNDATKPVRVTATISGITEEVLMEIEPKHREKITPFITEGELLVRRFQPTPNSKTKDIVLEVEGVDAQGKLQWQKAPTGIPEGLNKLFPEPIFIGAMENATEDVGKFGTSTTIGKLIRAIVEPITDDYAKEVNASLKDVANKLSADSPEKDADLLDLDMKIQKELTSLFPGLQAKTHIPPLQFEDFLRGATLRIFEEGYGNQGGQDAGSFGHGAQRSIQIALVKCLDGVKRALQQEDGRTTLLLIDEPELYLHPQAVETVRASLRRLAGDGYQVAFSTHSAGMISRHDAPNTLLIRRNAAVGTRAYPRIKDAVKDAIEGADNQAQTLFDLSNATKVLFSERIILAEGKTEDTILPELYSKVRKRSLEEEKLGLVSVGSSNNVPASLKVLEAMGVPSKAVVDLDFAFQVATRASLLPKGCEAINACKSELKTLEKAGKVTLDEQGLPRSGKGPAAEGYEKLAKSPAAQKEITKLHELLLKKNIWLWKRGAIEAHLGIHKTNKARRIFLEDLAKKPLAGVANDHDELVKLINWLKS